MQKIEAWALALASWLFVIWLGSYLLAWAHRAGLGENLLALLD